MSPQCATCDQPAPAGVRICLRCERRLMGWLRDVPELLEELDVTITRQDKLTSNRVGGRSSEKPLMFNEHASDTRILLESTLRIWANALGWNPYIDVGPTNVYIRNRMHVIRMREDVGDLYADVQRGIRKARQAIDRPAEKVFAGPCNTEIIAFGGVAFCAADLYAKPGKATVVCRDCGAEHEVASRREWMLREIRNHSADASLMSGILTQLGFPISAYTIRRYARDELLEETGVDARGVPTYNIGLVLDTFTQKNSQKSLSKGIDRSDGLPVK